MMVGARDEHGDGLSDEQLRDELITLIAAGHETTATATAWGVELLVHNPAVMATAREGDDAYLEALVKEILRIRSPIPITSARHMLEPFAIGPWTIPPEVAVLVDAYGVHHDPRTYPEPHAVSPRALPERAAGRLLVPAVRRWRTSLPGRVAGAAGDEDRAARDARSRRAGADVNDAGARGARRPNTAAPRRHTRADPRPADAGARGDGSRDDGLTPRALRERLRGRELSGRPRERPLRRLPTAR